MVNVWLNGHHSPHALKRRGTLTPKAGSYARYDTSPSMFLNENYLPELYVNQIPPKHEISRTINCDIRELKSLVLLCQNKSKVIEKDMKREIKNVAKLFLKGGMKRVICGLYPIMIFKDPKDDHMIATMDFCMVAYKD